MTTPTPTSSLDEYGQDSLSIWLRVYPTGNLTVYTTISNIYMTVKYI